MSRTAGRRWLLGGGFAAAGLAVVAVLLVGARGLFGPPPVSMEAVRPERFVREVAATGSLKTVDATPVTVPTDAEGPQKIAFMAADGSRVKAGEPVVLFDASEMERELANGRSDRDTADNKIGKTGAENRRTSRALDLDLRLVRREMDESEAYARKDPDIFSRNEIITSEIDAELLRKRLDATDYKKRETEKLGAADLALGEIERGKADIRIKQAEKTLGALRVSAPHDGLIVFVRNWRGETLSVGEAVYPGQKIAEIPDLSKLEARVYVLEADAGGLKPGLGARVVLEGYPGKEYAAEVSRVDAMAKTRNWRVPTKYFETILSLDAADPELMKPGQAVRAVISLEEIPDALSVPRGAVFEKDGKRIVYRYDDDHFEPVEVTLGSGTPARVVIEKGLKEGDRIALRDPGRPTSGAWQGTSGGDGARAAPGSS